MTNIKTRNLLKQVTYKTVQELFSSYFILKPNHILLDNLTQLFPDFSDSAINIRDFYNQAILKYYPNETTIKAAFLNDVLFKTKKDITIFELPVGGSRVDLCKINGTSIAYEIKTDLDTLRRLNKQISDYNKVFEQVYLICSIERLSEVLSIIPDSCGIYIYTISPRNNYRFEKYREASENSIFDSKQQLELFTAQELFDKYPDFSNSCKSETINNIMSNVNQFDINVAFKRMLKDRFASQWRFLKSNRDDIFEIDYQWFYQNRIDPNIVYGSSIQSIHS